LGKPTTDVAEMNLKSALRLEQQLAESQANDRCAMGYLSQVREIVGGKDFPEMVELVKGTKRDAERYQWLIGESQHEDWVVLAALNYYKWNEYIDAAMEKEPT
jgi:hypothetical protein